MEKATMGLTALLSSYNTFLTAVNKINVFRYSSNVPDIVVRFNQMWNFSIDYRDNSQHQITRKFFQWELRWYIGWRSCIKYVNTVIRVIDFRKYILILPG
jgi:hypothetical protein